MHVWTFYFNNDEYPFKFVYSLEMTTWNGFLQVPGIRFTMSAKIINDNRNKGKSPNVTGDDVRADRRVYSVQCGMNGNRRKALREVRRNRSISIRAPCSFVSRGANQFPYIQAQNPKVFSRRPLIIFH